MQVRDVECMCDVRPRSFNTMGRRALDFDLSSVRMFMLNDSPAVASISGGYIAQADIVGAITLGNGAISIPSVNTPTPILRIVYEMQASTYPTPDLADIWTCDFLGSTHHRRPYPFLDNFAYDLWNRTEVVLRVQMLTTQDFYSTTSLYLFPTSLYLPHHVSAPAVLPPRRAHSTDGYIQKPRFE
jgi:hypothetical protein